MKNQKTAVVLVSGGLDSATILAMAKERGYTPAAISFDYGQRHHFELAAAERVCLAAGVKVRTTVKIDLRAFGGSALTSGLDVPKDRSEGEMTSAIPITYVPARNTVFLSLALAWAEVLGASDLFIGVNAVDYSGYPDCRPEYISAFEKLANLGTKSGVEGSAKWQVHAPLVFMSKGEIIRRGIGLGVDYGLTHSCYDPSPEGLSCGHCDSCLLRLKGFADAGVADPIRYTGYTIRGQE
jgi:7-cyano-7-deazaguanine synthase